ncbi:MAG: hypothetical protein JNL41_06240 [Phenylobacterium sp.]|uniref:hypothetical protein n=1 Tax=Phenylobacterium sp. TaxID=1871053 RepID=UPI001A3C7D6A|nr:hypothetical protein [Phenylobacterium sp.]MBL8553860.1 hypothetical protein [Phenylobacterium sp.]
MSLINGLLGQLAENVDIENLAQKIGLSPEHVEQAVKALGVAHHEPGDTAEAAAATTGLPLEKMQEIIGHIGGEGSLGRFAEMLKEQGGSDLLGSLASGLLGRK